MDEIDRLKWFSRAVLGKELDFENAEEKELIQNAVYISQLLGAHWTYDFSWEARKINSKSLNEALFVLRDRELTYSPNSDEVEMVKKLKSVESLLGKHALYNRKEDAYELTAAMLYLKTSMPEDEVKSYVKKAKPWFGEEHINDTMEFSKNI